MKRPWLAIAIVLAVAAFALGVSAEAYDTFSPPALSFHVVLRKFESVVAFYAIGYALDRAVLEARRPLPRGCGALGIALYSAALEIAQRFAGSPEGLGWNAIDVLCGAVGGALADLTIAAQRRDRAARRRAARHGTRR